MGRIETDNSGYFLGGRITFYYTVSNNILLSTYITFQIILRSLNINIPISVSIHTESSIFTAAVFGQWTITPSWVGVVLQFQRALGVNCFPSEGLNLTEKEPMIEVAGFGWFLVAVLDLKHRDFSVNCWRQIHKFTNCWRTTTGFCLIAGLIYVNKIQCIFEW